MTLAPSAAQASATARPIPRPAPVTAMTFPSRRPTGGSVPDAPSDSVRPYDPVPEVDDPGTECAGLEELEVQPALALGEERNATAYQHRVDLGPVLVDQTQGSRLDGECRAADCDVALGRLSSQPPDLLRQAARDQTGIALNRRHRGGEHHLRQRCPERGPLEPRVIERWVLVGGLPVEHRLVQPTSQEGDSDLSYLLDGEAKEVLVGPCPVEAAIGSAYVTVQRDAHRIGHGAGQKSSSTKASTTGTRISALRRALAPVWPRKSLPSLRGRSGMRRAGLAPVRRRR